MYPRNSELSYEEIFGNNVKACREALGLSHKELAENILGYPEEILRRIESGEASNCRIDFMVSLSNYLEVPLEALLTNRYLTPKKKRSNSMKVKVHIKSPVRVHAQNTTAFRPRVRVVRVITRWPIAHTSQKPSPDFPADCICSECGELSPFGKTRFCPCCGTRMR